MLGVLGMSVDVDELKLDTEWDDYYDGFTAYSEGQIRDAEEVKAIPLGKVKQAREEINDLYRYFDNDCSSSNKDSMFKCCEVLVILDKLIWESK